MEYQMLVKPAFGKRFFEADGGDNAGNGSGGESQNAKPGGQQGDEGFKAITSEGELSEWKASVRKAIAADVRKQLEDEQKAKDAAAQVDAERAEAEKRGEFEKVRTSLESERDAAVAERDTLKATVESYEALIGSQVDTVKASLPEEALTGYPTDADPLTRMTWLTERQELIKALGVKANGEAPTRLPKTPEASGDVKTDIRESLKAIRYT